MEVGNVSFVAELDLSKAQAQLEEFRKQLNGIKVTSTSIGDFEKTIKKLNNQKITIKVNHNPLTGLNKHIDAKVAHVKKANTYFKNNPLKVETKIDELSYKELQSKVKALKEKGLTKIPLNAKKEVLRNELSKQSSVGNSGLNNCDCEGIKSELKAIRSILSVKLSKANNGITENAKNVRQLLATKSANPVSVTKQKESGLENTVKSLNQEIKQVIPEVISQLNSVIKTKQEPEKDTSQIEVLSRLSSIDNGIFHVFSSTEKLFGILKEQNKILEQKSEQKDEQKDSNINSEIKNGLSTINDSLVQILGTNKESNNALKSNNQIVTQIQTLLKQRHKEKEQLKSKTSKTQGMQPKEMPLGYQVALKAILGAFKGLDINEIEIPMLKEKDSSTTGRASYLASDNSISLNTEIYERLMKGEATKNDLKTLIHELVHAVTNGFKKTSGLDNNLKEKIKPNTPLNIPLSESAKKQASTFSGRYVAGQVYPQKQIVKVEDEFLAEAVALTLQDKVFEVFEFLSGKSNTPATLTQETELVQIIQLLSDIYNALLKTTEAEIIPAKQSQVEKQKPLKRTSSISLSQSNSESLSLGREKKMTVEIDGEKIDLLKLNPKFVELVREFTSARSNPNLDFDAFSELSDRLVSLADDLNEWNDDGESLKHPYDYGILMEHIMEGSFVDQQGFDDNDEVSYSLDDTAIVDVINQSNTYLKGIRRTCDEIFDRLNKPLDVSETKGKTQATPQTKGMKPSEMPLGYQVALKAILSAFDLKIEDIAIPELVEMSKEDSKIAEGSYSVATNKIHLPKKDMDNLKNNNIDELLMKTLIHELVHAVINNFRTGWEEDDLQSTMVGDFIQPRVVNIPLKENAKQLSQGFLALYKDDPAYLEGSMIGKTGEYNAEVVAMSLMLEAYALYEQMLDNPNYLGKDKNKFDSFAVKESYEVKVVKLLENIFNLLKAKFGIETKTEDKPKTTTSSNETQPEDKPKTTRGRKPKSSTSPEVLPSLLDTDSLSLSLDDDTGTEELLKSPVLFYKEFMKRMPLIQKEFEKIDIKNLKKTIQKLPVELKEELQDNLDDVKLSFNNLSSVEKNFKYIEKAFNNYEKSKNKNKKALKGFLGYSEIEAELKKVYAQLEQKQELDIDLDIEKEPLWETIQLLESLLEKSESLADITIDFPSMDAFIKDSGWIDWLSDADLSKIDEELVESFSGYAKGIIGEWETIIPALDHIFKEITALSEEEGYEIQKNLSAGSPGLITDILDIWQRRGLSGLGEIFDRITVSAQESSNEMQNALGGFLEYFDFDIKRFAFDKITDGLREITVGAFNSALQVENLARQLTFSTGKSGATELQRIKRESQDLGINFIEAAEGYRQFSASTLGTSMNAMSGELVSKFQKSFAAYGLNREQQQGAFLALSQMASKGVVSMEELRQQLSERLPGAINAAASSMGMAVPEFNKLVESGQVLAEDLLPKMADQLEQDTGIALMQTVKSTQSELTRLENNIFNIQAGLGQLQLTLAKLGLPILNAMLKTLVDNMDWIAIVIGSLAISIGVKLVGSILLTNIAIIKSIGLINALSLAFGTLWASLGPILPLALIISGIAVAVKGLHGTITAHTKEIKEYNNALKELAIIEAKIRKDEKPKKDGKRYDRTTKDFWNENSWDASVDFITQRSTRQANEFINDSKMANEALQSVTDSIINASKRTRDIDIGNGVTVGNDLSEDTITKVQDRLTDLRTQSANLKFKIAVLADKGDLEKVKKLQEELGKVNKEIGRVSTEPFAEVAVMEKRLKAVQALAEQFEMKKTEMELKGLDSRASQYNMWLEEARKLEAEINEQIEKRNEAIKEANDLYTKRIQTLRQLQRELAKINYMTQLEGIDNQITAIQRRTGGETSEYQFDQEMRQARAIEVETKLKLSTEAFNIYENDVKSMLSNLDADLKTQIATEIGVADLDKALMEKKVSPEAFAQLTGDMVSQEIKDLVEQSPDLKELIVKSQDYLTTWQDIKQQQLESANVVKEQFDADKQRKSDLRDFKRQLEDLDLSIADYFRQRARGLEDFETQYQDIAIQNQRQSRDLLEQYQDLGRTLNLQLLQAKNRIATLEKNIKRQTLINNARQSLNFGADGLFSGFINLVDELMASENEFDEKELTLNEQRLQTEEEIVNIARQIRSLQEQVFDAEKQRIAQLRDLMRAQEDWIIQQKSSWLSITRQVEDMERQAKEMGLSFSSIADLLDGINGSYVTIHNAIADMATQIQNSANNMSVGGASQTATGTGTTSGDAMLVGTIGLTGRTTGPHLHFKVMVNGEAVDPTPYLDKILINGKPAKDYPVTSGYGWRKDPKTGQQAWHDAIDIGAPVGSKIEYVGEGEFLGVTDTKGKGGVVSNVLDNQGVQYSFMHLETDSLKLNDPANRQTRTVATPNNSVPSIATTQVQVPNAPKDKPIIVATKSGKKDADGLDILRFELVQGGKVIDSFEGGTTGRADNQDKAGTNATHKAGSETPLPDGTWKINKYNAKKIPDIDLSNYTPESIPTGQVGPAWIGLTPDFNTGRSQIGIHMNDIVPGTAGCIAFTDPAQINKIASWVMKDGASNLFVDLNADQVKRVQQQAQNTTSPVTSQVKQGSKPKRNKIFTFDDGPNPETTPKILEELRARDEKATFYILGVMAELYPQLVQQIYKEGHQIGVHGYSHRNLATLDKQEVNQELKITRDLLNSIIRQVDPNFKGVSLFRAPYGEAPPFVNQEANKLGLSNSKGWDVDTNDWSRFATSGSIKNSIRSAEPNEVILLHDGQDGAWRIKHSPEAQRLIKKRFPNYKPRQPHKDVNPDKTPMIEGFKQSQLTPQLNLGLLPLEFEQVVNLTPVIEQKQIDKQLSSLDAYLPVNLVEGTGFKDNLNFNLNKGVEVAQKLPEKTNYRDAEWENIQTPKDAILWINKILKPESLRDMTALFSFESGSGNFSTSNMGGDGNNYMGYIQASPDAREKLGMYPGMSHKDYALAVVRYFLEFRGGIGGGQKLRPGATLQEMYDQINPGFGDVRPQLEKGGHFARADKLLGDAVFDTATTNVGGITKINLPDITNAKQSLNTIVSNFNTNNISSGTPMPVSLDQKTTTALSGTMAETLNRGILTYQNVDEAIELLKQNMQPTQQQMSDLLFFKDQNNYPAMDNYMKAMGFDLATKKEEILDLERKNFEEERKAKQLENEKKTVDGARQALQAIRQQQEAVRNLDLQLLQFNETIYGYLTASEKALILEKERMNQFENMKNQIASQREELDKFVDYSDNPEQAKESLIKVLNGLKASGSNVLTPEIKAKMEEYFTLIDKGMDPLILGRELVIALQKAFDKQEESLNKTTEKMSKYTKELTLLQNQINAINSLIEVFDKVDSSVSNQLKRDLAVYEAQVSILEKKHNLEMQIESLERELAENGTTLTLDEKRSREIMLEQAKRLANQFTNELTIKITLKNQLDLDFQNIADQISAVLDIGKKVAERAEKDNPFEGARYQAEISELEIIIDLQNQLKAIEDARTKFQDNPEMLSRLDEYEKRVKEFAEVDLSRIKQEVNVFARAIKDPLNNAFKGLFSDFIRGTKTLKDLFLDFANSVADFFADLAAKMATQWVMDKIWKPEKEEDKDKDKEKSPVSQARKAFKEMWNNFNGGQGNNGNNNNGITYSTLPLPKGFEIPQLQPMSTNIEDMTSNVTYDILQSNPVGTMNITLPPQMQQGGSNILSGLFSGLIGGVTSGLSSGFSGLFTGANPFSGGAGLAMPSSYINPNQAFSNPLSFASGITLPTFSQGGVVESAINSYLFGGVVSSFAKGGVANNIKSFSRGGNIIESASLGLSVMKAMKKEGSNAVPVVAHIGERFLSAKTGDAQIFNQMEQDGIWDEYKRNRFNPEVKSFNAGGIVGNGIRQFTRNYNNSNRVQNQNTIINVNTPDALSFRKSRSQLAQEEKLAQKRMERFK